MEMFQVYYEARAAAVPILQYFVVCLNGRFDWLPYEDVIQEAIMEDALVETE